MTKISVEEAQTKLSELIAGLSQGEELAIMQGDQVVARLVGERFAKGMMTIVAEDDEHLRDFAEYMP